MARKKKSPIEEESRRKISDGRFNKPLDLRAQKLKYKKDLKRLRDI